MLPDGQYGSTLLQAVAGDRLTPENGIRISELSPVSCYRSFSSNALTLL